MTLLELQEVLGHQIELITDEKVPFESRVKQANVATAVSSLAKQMINNADVVLRASKFTADSKLDRPEVMEMLNGGYVLMKKDENGMLSGKTI